MSVVIEGKSYDSYETPRLIIKPCCEEDARFIFKLMNTEKWFQYIGDRDVKSVEEAQAYIRTKMYPQLKRLGYGNYTVIRKADEAKMGTVGMYDREGLEGLDIGFAFLPEFEAQGYAFEASEKLKNICFDNFGITEIGAITRKDNLRSQRLLERLGLRFNKTVTLPNDDVELMYYLLKKDS